ncbi:MAG TPA: ABC transporter permease [Pyrinomonadaceae bacterium]|nr:ABC transporter permease [Pyrinomonadaceae bacterium]
METLIKDVRYGLRSLMKHPAFTAITVLTLALGIGANAAIFSLVNAVLLKPLSFPEPDRLVMVWEDQSAAGFPRSDVAPGTFNDWRAEQSVFEGMAALDWHSFNITGDGEPEKISSYGVTANFFPLLGIQPALGRNFSPAEDKPEAGKVAILSYGLWQRRYGGDREILTRDILLNGEKYSVIGVMPKGFQFLQSYVGLWTPAAFTAQQLADHDNHYITVVGRMKRGVSLEQARADIKAITQHIVLANPEEAAGMGSVIVPLREQLAGNVRRPLILLLVSVGMVLLIACANIASLLLSRAAARRREIAVRTALGASRRRIVRQLLTESIMLAGFGGGLGLLVSTWSFALLGQLIPEGMVVATTLKIDLPVLVYAVAVSVITGIIFGLAPALQLSKIDLTEALKQGGGRTGLSAASQRLRGTFIVAQVALALVLLVGAGLLMQTVFHLREQYSGFQPDRLLTMRTVLPAYKYDEPFRRVVFYDQVLERVKELPGVSGAGYTTSVPLQWKGGANGFTIEGQTQPRGFPNAIHRQVSTEYLQVMGIGLRRGRYFDDSDQPQSTPVAIINETFARQYWPNEDPLGKRFKLGVPKAPWVTVVGIVNDVRQMGMDDPVKAEMYFPYRQITSHFGYAPRDLIVRTSGDPMSLVAAVRQQVHLVDPDQPISNIASMDQLLTEETGPRRLGMILLGAFAGFALLLSSLGLYGVLSYLVQQQTPEIGVRMALGAQRINILGLIFKKGMTLVLVGVVIGLAAAFGLTRLMTSLLFGVSATDPLTFLFISLLLIAVALLACYIPARRATKVDPLVALRYE